MEVDISKRAESDEINREISDVESKKSENIDSLQKNEKDAENIKKVECSQNSSVKNDKHIPSSQTMLASNQSIEKDENNEEDDVPGDFFDDFLKEDFMAGLDVVDEDEWDEEKEKQATEDSMDSTKTKKKKLVNDQRQTRRKEENVDLRDKLREKRRNNYKERKEKEIVEKSKEKTINADEFDIRRDPKKTRRDIERDKARCEKDKEKKIISEKLKLVETGLVPPGMEMEIDLEKMQKGKETVEIGKSQKKSEPRSISKNSSSMKRRSISPRKRISRNQKRSSPPRRKSPRKLSRSPIRGARRRSRDRNLSRSLDRLLRRSLDRNPRRSAERMERGRRSRSPAYRSNNYKYSPRHKRSRSRSRSPKRRREGDKKKSFLQEIADKLNETRHVTMMPYQTHSTDMYHLAPHSQVLAPPPVPAPVPPPVSNQYQNQQQYDQSFFIGAPQTSNNINPVNVSSIDPVHYSYLNKMTNYQQHSQDIDTNKNKDDVTRLFQDKKITLTEFLAITAKPEVYSASPAHMKEKIKVISRCQDAIKFLGNSEKKFAGPLIIQKRQKPKPISEKFKSPLMRSSMLKLPFTEIPKSEQQRTDFTSHVNNLLQNLGLLDDDVIVIDDVDPATENNFPSSMKNAPTPVISDNTKKLRPSVDLNFKQFSKYVQTEEPKCIDCDKRKKILYKNVGTQCGNDGMSFSIGTQVRDDDFFVKFPKNQSLAALTPAQLLARSGVSMSGRNIDPDEFNIPYNAKKPIRPPGFSYASDSLGPVPPRFVPAPPGRSFEPPNVGRGLRDWGLDNRPDSHRFNNYY